MKELLKSFKEIVIKPSKKIIKSAIIISIIFIMCALISKIILAVEPNNLTNGLIEFYPFDNFIGSTSAGVHNGLPSNLTGVNLISTTDCVIGNCTDLSVGSTAHINLSNIQKYMSSTTPFTLNLWLSIVSADAFDGIFETKNSAGTTFTQSYFNNINNFVLQNATSTTIIYKNIANQWTMITYEVNGSHMNIYLNGSLSNTSNTYLYGLNNIGYKLMIGNSIGATTRAINGKLDEVGLWNRTLNNTEKSLLYNSGLGLRYPFNETTSYINFINQTPIDITDLNIMGNNLTIIYNFNQTGLNITSPYINYTINSGSITVNGSVISQPRIKTYINFTNSTYTFVLDDNDVYPAIYNIDEDNIMDATIHNNITITNSNEFYKVNLYGLNTSKTNNILELQISMVGNGIIYYCNSTYISGNLNINPNCILFASFNNNTYNHIHNNSKHNVFSLPIVNGTIGGIVLTNLSSFVIGKSSGTATLGYINTTVRPDTVQRSINLGQVWNNQSLLIDMHLHQFNENDAFNYAGCSSNSSSTICSFYRTDVYNTSLLPPTAVSISLNKYDFVYSENITAIRNNSFGFNSTIVSYGFNVVNDALNFIANINQSTNATTVSFNTSNLSNGYYFIKVSATDTNNQVSNSYSNTFYVHSNYLTPCNATITLNSSGVPLIFNFTQNTRNETVSILGFYGILNLTFTNNTNTIIISNTNYSSIHYNIHTLETFNTDTNCTLYLCTSNYVRQNQPCTSSLRLINYTDKNNCNIYGYALPSDANTYEDCALPPNTDKSLWLIIILLIIWIIAIFVSLTLTTYAIIGAWLSGIAWLYYTNIYFSTALPGIILMLFTALLTFLSIMLMRNN